MKKTDELDGMVSGWGEVKSTFQCYIKRVACVQLELGITWYESMLQIKAIEA